LLREMRSRENNSLSLSWNKGRHGPLEGEGVVGQHIKSISYDCLKDCP